MIARRSAGCLGGVVGERCEGGDVVSGWQGSGGCLESVLASVFQALAVNAVPPHAIDATY